MSSGINGILKTKSIMFTAPRPNICKAYTEKPNHISFSASKISNVFFFFLFFRDRYTRKFTMSHQDHHHSQNPDHLKTSFFLHPLAQLFPSLAFPCDTFFFFFYIMRPEVIKNQPQVMSILSLTLCLENEIYIFMEILKMMVFFHVSHLLFSNQYNSLQSTEPLYLEIFLNWQIKISLTYYC